MPDGRKFSVAEIIEYTDTDGWMVVHDHPQRGPLLLAERYAGGMGPSTLHLMMSLSKSVVGIVTGALVAQGLVDTDAPVTHYVPALSVSGYAGATVRHLLGHAVGHLLLGELPRPGRRGSGAGAGVRLGPPEVRRGCRGR